MAFCGSCGAQLDGNQRFCGKCGADQAARADGAAGAPAMAAAQVAGTPVSQPMGAAPGSALPHLPFVSAGQVPMSVAMPPQAPAKKSGMMWLAVLVAVGGAYYYYTHYMQPQGQPANAPQTQPGPQGQPGQQPGGYPGQQPAGYPGQQPGGYPGQQPGGQGQGGGNASLAQMQSFTGTVSEENGNVEISNGQWQNGASVAVASVTLECIQYSSAGQALTQDTATLSGPNGPAPPQSTVTFDPFSVGQVVQGAASAKCGITDATPAS